MSIKNDAPSTPSPANGTDGGDKSFFGQPRPLATLFGVEMWERFSFYGMQGILAIYLYYSVENGGLGLPQGVALSLVGAYGGTVYLSTIVGAWLADRVFGPERVLFFSAVVIMVGHIALSLIPGMLGVGIGLVLVAFGSGGLKANATSIVGTLYSAEDPRRDAGFSLFYLGINIGGFLGPILTGLLQSKLGFHFGFAAAAIGMALGLAQYAIGRRRLPAAAHTVSNPLPKAERGRWIAIALGAVALIAVLCIVGVITIERISLIVVALTVIAAIAYFSLILASKKITRTERRRVFAFIPLFLGSVAFWTLYQQQFTVLTAYSDSRLDRNLFGIWEMPVVWVQSINPVFIMILSGVFAALWTKLGSRQPATPTKFGLAAIGMGVAYLLFLPMAGGGPGTAPLLALVGILFLFTVSELTLSPVGLSVSTKLAPKIFRTQMVALFFLSIAIGSSLAGTLATYYSPDTEIPYFGMLGGVSILIGLALVCARKPILRLMSGVN